MADQQGNVFWYFAGRRPQRVNIGGVPSLVSPHFYCLAPPDQKWPSHCAHLFTRRTPPKDILEKFGASGERAETMRKAIEKETRAVETARQDAEKAKAKARREGQPATEPLPMKEAIKEEGAKKPPVESQSESSPSQSDKGKGKGKGKDKDKD